jgi:menaquinone-dependent protoporphyrinogen oxidase
MGKVLIVYGTGEGHSDDVVDVIAKQLQSKSVQVQASRVADAPSAPEGFDTVVVGSSIHMGKHDKNVVHWIERNRRWLTDHPSAFFQVSMSSSGGTPEGDAEATSYVNSLTTGTGWHPDIVGLFGGALLYTRYGFVKRHVMKAIAEKQGMGTDTHRDYDFTDYDAVRHFADDVAALTNHST